MFDDFLDGEKLYATTVHLYCGMGIGGQTSTQMLARFSDDGCHPDPDTYFIMEELVLKAISEALK